MIASRFAAAVARSMLAFGLFSAVTASAQATGTEAEPTVLKLSPYLGVVWTVEADLGGRKQNFLFDTAGGITVITPEAASAAGCEPWGKLSGFRMRGDRVDLQRCEDVTLTSGQSTLRLQTVGVWDFSGLLPKGAPPIAGSIALDSFADKAITIDLANRQIVIETPTSLKRRTAEAVPVALRLGREVAGQAITPFVAVETRKGRLWMELDTGSDAPIIVGSHSAFLFGMDSARTGPQLFEGRLSGGVSLRTAGARSMPLIIDGNIGLPSWPDGV